MIELLIHIALKSETAFLIAPKVPLFAEKQKVASKIYVINKDFVSRIQHEVHIKLSTKVENIN